MLSLQRWAMSLVISLPAICSAQSAPVVPLASEVDPSAPVAPPVAPVVPLSDTDVSVPTFVSTPPPGSGQSGGFEFKNVPPPRTAPRTGPFQMPPTGPGYYSIIDLVRKDWQDGPPKAAYPRFALMAPSFFDADYRYLDDPGRPAPVTLWYEWSDRVKRMRLGDDWMLSLGGSTWYRGMGEYNSRLGQADNNYLLSRDRLFADLWYKDVARLYVEGTAAFSRFESLPALPIDETGFDFLNLFVDLKVADVLGKPVYVRGGRQELNLGSQRLVSSLDWANTRRTFQGASVLRTGENWDFTGFWTQPVVPNPDKLDWADVQQHFAGGWLTYKVKPGTTLDVYNLTLVNNNTVVQRGIQRGNATLNTTGVRFAGDHKNVLWDLEGAVQLGRQAGQDVDAAMATAGLGYNFKGAPWSPTAWVFYDFASGGRSGTRSHTFNQLFPFGHYYLGWADLIGRQNIQDLNAHVYFYPAKWLTCWVQYHRFWLADRTDALYNTAGNVSRLSAAGAAGNGVGRELDFVMNFHLTRMSDVLVGYSHFFAGDFVKRTAAPGQTSGFDASTVFLQYNVRW